MKKQQYLLASSALAFALVGTSAAQAQNPNCSLLNIQSSGKLYAQGGGGCCGCCNTPGGCCGAQAAKKKAKKKKKVRKP